MSRWHKDSCHIPNVCLIKGVPRCQACGNSALDASETSSTSRLTSPIPDSLLSDITDLGLSWPSCVPWRRDGPIKQGDHDGRINELPRDLLYEEAPCVAGTATNSLSFLYGRRLGPDEFRLICLDAVADDNSPIHLTLETYAFNDCPEYETVSYTWASENGDMRTSEPVYIGIYWDMLPQTKNCASLLRYLRPSRGLRLVWIDAICINQQDSREKESQVIKMGDFYRHCSRVVVWLGGDIVDVHSEHHRPRYRFHEIHDKTVEHLLDQILARRYFNRIWVIQELILSPRSIFPIFNMEFFADRSTPSRLALMNQEWAWRGPWLQYIHTGEFLEGTDLFQTLGKTWASKATDPRDKIFGVIGLHNDNKTASLAPDYSLSVYEVYVGTFAYLLANLRHFEVLLNAAGTERQVSLPSWMPDLQQSNWLVKGRLHPSNEEIESVRSNTARVGTQTGNIMIISSDSSYFDYNWKDLNYDDMDDSPSVWHDDIFFNSSDASVSMELVHVMKLNSVPVFRYSLTDSDLRGYSIRTASCELLLCIGDTSFYRMIGTEPNHLFLSELKGRKGSLLFILREAHRTGYYNLVTCCFCYELFLISQDEPSEQSVRAPFQSGKKADKVYLTRFWKSLHASMMSFRLVLSDDIEGKSRRRPSQLMILILHKTTKRLSQESFQAGRGHTKRFFSS